MAAPTPEKQTSSFAIRLYRSLYEELKNVSTKAENIAFSQLIYFIQIQKQV
jgi:hypothetical protein